jgi:hypothetical protein
MVTNYAAKAWRWRRFLRGCERLHHKLILGVYCEIGIELYRLVGDYAVYDDALRLLKVAESVVGDPEISKTIRRYERLMAGQSDATEVPLEEEC